MSNANEMPEPAVAVDHNVLADDVTRLPDIEWEDDPNNTGEPTDGPADEPSAEAIAAQEAAQAAALAEAEEFAAAKAEADRVLVTEQHLANAGKALDRLSAAGKLGPVDHAALHQGAMIGATHARAARVAHPHSTPEASVVAIEAAPKVIQALQDQLDCYRNLAHAAALGADISDALETIDAIIG